MTTTNIQDEIDFNSSLLKSSTLIDDNKYNNLINNEKQKTFFQLSLIEIMNNWSNISVLIIKELVDILSLQNYKQYFNNVEDGNQIYLGIYELIKDIFHTFVKDDRGYYSGMSIIIISILIYYIYITSNKKILNVSNNK
tara:strand:- start:235 stop:651 length:417 start_codon:yes stop_codon:yes gene_type:complete